MATNSQKQPWYHQGLPFECQGCGDCCRGPGGYVWTTLDEAKDIAEELDIPFEKFAATMLRQTTTGLALVDDKKGDCPLLGDNGKCRVYTKRPVQCRTWPWWDENLISEDHWKDAASRCPGMNKGQVHSAIVIECERAKEF